MRRWIILLFAIAVGLGLGLYYGWVVSPVEYVDTSPNTLSADFRTDYVLMVSEAYESRQDVTLAARQLGIFGGSQPAEVAAQALADAAILNYSSEDLQKMQTLMLALQSGQAPGELP
jgi:hypothetical protein